MSAKTNRRNRAFDNLDSFAGDDDFAPDDYDDEYSSLLIEKAEDVFSRQVSDNDDFYDAGALPLINVINFAEYMRKHDYIISSDTFGGIFKLMAATGKRLDELESAVRTMVVKDSAKIPDFILLFARFIHNIPDEDEELLEMFADSAEETKKKGSALEEKINKLEKKIESKKKSIEKKEKEKQSGYKSGREKLEKKKEKIKEKMEKEGIKEDVKKLSEKTGFDLENPDAGKMSANKRSEKMMKAAQESLGMENAEKLLSYIKDWLLYFEEQEKWTDGVKQKALDDEKAMLDRYEKAKQKAEEERGKIEKALQNPYMRDIEKAGSFKNREKFEKEGAHASVRLTGPGTSNADVLKSLKENFDTLTEKERENILDYIKDNARNFRTRLSGNYRTGQKRTVDMAETVKEALRSGGVPMKIHFKKPEKKKTNIVMILDVSGSCKEASYMMLYLMYCIQDVFPSGCKSYVFVDSLIDISSFFDAVSPDDAIDAVFSNVRTKGVYSNYYNPLKQINDEHMGEITNDSIVIFIGDARNNRNLSGEEFLKKIHDKTKKLFWLNTEEKDMWGTGDSIMPTYKPYAKDTIQTVNTEELIDALMEIAEENR